MVTRALEMLWLDQNLKIFYEISIFWTTQKMTKVTKVAELDPLSTILTRVLVILFQSIDEHMVKFNGRSSTKQYVENKPIKWDFKFLYHYSSGRIRLSI